VTYEEALQRIHKLLALSSNNPSVEEASLAASKAATIMLEYKISEAALSSVEEENESLVSSFEFDEESKQSRKKIHWRMRVTSGVARVCSCSSYWHGSQIMLIGRDQDVKAAKYLFDLICPQVEELAKRAWDLESRFYAPEHGDCRRFLHAFRLGCSQTIRDRLIKAAREKESELSRGLGSTSPGAASMALMVISNRLAKVDEYRSQLGLIAQRGPTVTSRDGYSIGKDYGHRVNIGGKSKGGLSAPRERVTA
jgi:hypothetical protein